MFLSDLESILKILSVREIEDCVLPALEIYSSEQEFLKLQFFQKLPCLFFKLLVTQKEVTRLESMNLLVTRVYPLIAKLMIDSEE